MNMGTPVNSGRSHCSVPHSRDNTPNVAIGSQSYGAVTINGARNPNMLEPVVTNANPDVRTSLGKSSAI